MRGAPPRRRGSRPARGARPGRGALPRGRVPRPRPRRSTVDRGASAAPGSARPPAPGNCGASARRASPAPRRSASRPGTGCARPAVVRLGHRDVRRDDLPGQDPPLASLSSRRRTPPARGRRGTARPRDPARPRLACLRESPDLLPHGEAADEGRGQHAEVAAGAAEAGHGARAVRRVAERAHPQHRVLDRGVRHVATQREQQIAVPAVRWCRSSRGRDGAGASRRAVTPRRRRARSPPRAPRSRRRPSPPTAPRRRDRRARPEAEPPPPRERARAASGARVRAVARLAPLGEPLELGPRDARQLRLRVEERPHRELRPHGNEMGRVQASRPREHRQHAVEGLPHGGRGGPDEFLPVAREAAAERFEVVRVGARAGDRLDARLVQERPAGHRERGEELPVAGDRIVEEQRPVGEAAHLEVGVAGEGLEPPPHEPAETGLGPGQEVRQLRDRLERGAPPRRGPGRSSRALRAAPRRAPAWRARAREARRGPRLPAAAAAATRAGAARPSRPCTARRPASSGSRARGAAGGRRARGRPPSRRAVREASDAHLLASGPRAHREHAARALRGARREGHEVPLEEAEVAEEPARQPHADPPQTIATASAVEPVDDRGERLLDRLPPVRALRRQLSLRVEVAVEDGEVDDALGRREVAVGRGDDPAEVVAAASPWAVAREDGVVGVGDDEEDVVVPSVAREEDPADSRHPFELLLHAAGATVRPRLFL